MGVGDARVKKKKGSQLQLVRTRMWHTGPTISASGARGFAPIHSYTRVHTSRVHAGVVVFFHGLGMHARMPRYERLADAFARAGFAFVAWDCPCHGTSSSLGTPQHSLRPGALPRAVDLTQDAVAFVRAAQASHPTLPVVLVGESLGAALALRIAPIVSPAAVLSLAGLVRTWVTKWGPLVGGELIGASQLARMVLRAGPVRIQQTWRDPLVSKRPPRASVYRCAFALVRVNEEESLPALRAPVLFSIGTRDALFRPKDTLRAYLHCNGVPVWKRSLQIVAGAQHHDHVERHDVLDAAVGFARHALGIMSEA